MVNIPIPNIEIVELQPPPANFVGPLPIIRLPSQNQWRDTSFMSQLLKEKFSVDSMIIGDAVEAGENYGSNVMQAKVETSLGTISLFIKSMPQSEFRSKFMIEMEIFKREITMYTETLPLVKSCFSKPNFPSCIYHELNNKTDTIILRDLRPDGYKTRPRQLGLDEPHCRMALSELAHLHGHSIAIRIQQPEIFESAILKVYTDKMYDEVNRENTQPFFASIVNGIADSICQNLPLRFRVIGEMMKEKISAKAFDMIKEHIQLPSDPVELSKLVLCLNHGDFWSNNVLFKYNENNQPIACSMVDFQMARCSSPVLDLLYFFFSSTTQKLRREHMFGLLEFYMSEVRSALTARGVAHHGKFFYATLQEMHQEMMQRKPLGFVMACIVIPAVVADMSQVDGDLDQITEDVFKNMDANPFAKMYSGKLFCCRIKEMIEEFDDMGFFIELSKSMK